MSRAVDAPALAPELLAEFGHLLRDRRSAARLSRAALGRRCKLSEATLKLIETARRAPSRQTLIRLIAVKELGLSWADVASLGGESPRIDGAPAPACDLPVRLNCLVVPRCDPLHLEQELRRFLQGAGGHLEQWAAYHAPHSALAYLATCNQGTSGTLRGSYPIAKISEAVARAAGGTSLRLIALGAGAGALELRLAQHIQSESGARDLEVCLIDQSAPLLCAALDGAASAFSATPARCWGLLAGFAQLPALTAAYAETGPSPRRRVFLLLGETLADIESEHRFFAHDLQGPQPGDLLVLDFLHAASNPERDPLTVSGLSPMQESWLSGIGRRYWPEHVRPELALTLDPYAALPGGYAVNARALVWQNQMQHRDFSLYRFKRYAPQTLADTLRSCGWEVLTAISLDAGRYQASVFICRKQAEGSK
ncbi:MAG: helix-turn-helix transcriptional regulator [Polyangia bacterium]